MNILGIAAGFHDASATVLSRDGEILFAGHSERYSKIKSDPNISRGLVEDMYGFEIDHVVNSFYVAEIVKLPDVKLWLEEVHDV